MVHPRGRVRRGTRYLCGIVAVVLVVMAACAHPSTSTERTYTRFAPSEVDRDNTMSTDTTSFAGAPFTGPRERLVVLLGGTGGSALSLANMATELQYAGFHVLGVTYDSALGTLAACPDSAASTDPDCHRRFRAETVFGENVEDPDGIAHDHAGKSVGVADSAMSLVIKHIEYAVALAPEAGFEQFLQMEDGVCVTESLTYGGCEPRWEDISLLGYSQGAGVALYMAKFVPVARVAMFAGPYDALGPRTAPVAAPWIAEGGFATPVERMTVLAHVNESNIWRIRSATGALGLPGPEVNVRDGVLPSGGSLRLVSDITPSCHPIDSSAYHNAVATNTCSDAGRYRDVWAHMAD